MLVPITRLKFQFNEDDLLIELGVGILLDMVQFPGASVYILYKKKITIKNHGQNYKLTLCCFLFVVKISDDCMDV